MISSRQAAFETLYKVSFDDAYSNIAVDNALTELSDGKAFAARLIYGVLERQLTLDYLINKYCNKPKPKLKVILRMGVYQLYFMNKVTSAAAIDESVKLAKANGLKYYASFVNAVLRKVDENRIDIDSLSDLSIRYSVPQHLINMWSKAYGKEVVDNFLPFLNERPPVFAVPNINKTDVQELCDSLKREDVSCTVAEGLVKIDASSDITQLKAFNDGLFHIQDISCCRAISALYIQNGDTVFDFCAAPGGKSFYASYFAGSKGKIFSFDLHDSRVELIKAGALRLGLNNISAAVNDACIFNISLGKADKIICDVPCSGFGIVRRKPEIRYKELDSVKGLPEIQYKILSTSAEYLKVGGKLMYSTCTLNKKENEKVVQKFLNENSNYAVCDMKTIFPGENGGDGFFYCIIERK